MGNGRGQFQDQERVCARSLHGLEDSLQIRTGPSDLETLWLQTQCACLLFMMSNKMTLRVPKRLISEERHTRQPRHHLLQEFELLPGLLRVKGGEPRQLATGPLQTRD